MKKTITQLMLVSTFVLLGSTLFAQCNGTVDIKNVSQDDWTISYYNNNIFVPASSSTTLGFINADPQIGRGVILGPVTSTTAACSHKFQNNPDIWNPPCTTGTTQVTYTGALDIGTGCFNSGLIYIE